MGLRDSVNPQISFSMEFAVWSAAIAAGATLDELAKLHLYPVSFRAKLVAWHQGSNAVKAHSEDAARAKAKRK